MRLPRRRRPVASVFAARLAAPQSLQGLCPLREHKRNGLVTMELSEIRASPLGDFGIWSKEHPAVWHGQLVSHDKTPTAPFTEADVEEVIGYGDDGDEWDGTVAAVLKLKDGRFVSWETFFGPTGHGFSEDAYGGNADLHFARDLETVVRLGLTNDGRRLTGLT